MIKVTLENYSPIQIALKAALVCTASENRINTYDAENFLSKLVSAGHESVIEHVVYTFFIEGVSRALLQEIARHRHVSLSVQSTRWALSKTATNDYVYSVKEVTERNNPENCSLLVDLFNLSKKLQSKILEAAVAGVPNDVLKYYVQESMTTKLAMTVNARELRHIFKLRLSEHALLEFQMLCHYLYQAIPVDHQFFYSEFFEPK